MIVSFFQKWFKGLLVPVVFPGIEWQNKQFTCRVWITRNILIHKLAKFADLKKLGKNLFRKGSLEYLFNIFLNRGPCRHVSYSVPEKGATRSTSLLLVFKLSKSAESVDIRPSATKSLMSDRKFNVMSGFFASFTTKPAYKVPASLHLFALAFRLSNHAVTLA